MIFFFYHQIFMGINCTYKEWENTRPRLSLTTLVEKYHFSYGMKMNQNLILKVFTYVQVSQIQR